MSYGAESVNAQLALNKIMSESNFNRIRNENSFCSFIEEPKNCIKLELNAFPQYDIFKSKDGKYTFDIGTNAYKKLKELNKKMLEIVLPILLEFKFYRFQIPFQDMISSEYEMINRLKLINNDKTN